MPPREALVVVWTIAAFLVLGEVGIQQTVWHRHPGDAGDEDEARAPATA